MALAGLLVGGAIATFRQRRWLAAMLLLVAIALVWGAYAVMPAPS